jgi:tape measure domain-containing protein
MVVRIVGDNSQLDRSIDQSQSKMQAFGEKAKRVGSSLTKFVTLPILGLGAAALKSAADMEVQEAAFETLLGSAEAARGMLQELTDFSAKTPFQLKDLAQATKTMLSFGIAQEKIMPNLQSLGDIAQGDSEKLKSLTLAFSQIQSTGRLMGQDLLQLINAGFNPLLEISEKTGESMADLKERMSDGAISAEEITNAFISATSEGGRFFGGMEKASQTLTGQISTLKDNVAILGREIVSQLLPVIKKIVAQVTDWVRQFQGLDDQTKKTILTVAGIAAAAGPAILAIGKIVTIVKTLKTTLSALTGPAGLLGLFIGALVTLGIKVATTKTAIDQEVESIRDKRDALKEANEQMDTAVELQGKYLQNTEQELIVERSRLEVERKNAAERNKNLLETIRLANRWAQAVAEGRKDAEAGAVVRQELERRGLGVSLDSIKILGETLKLEQEQAEAVALGNFERVKAIDAALKQIAASKELNTTTEDLITTTGDLNDNLNEGEDGVRKLGDAVDLFALDSVDNIGHVDLGLGSILENLIFMRKATADTGEGIQDEFADVNSLLDAQIARQQEVIENYKTMATTISGYLSPVLEELGAQLVQEQFSWESLAKVAVQGIAQVIRSLAEQAAIQSAIAFATGDAVRGFALAGASALGFVAAGAVSAYADTIGAENEATAQAAAGATSQSQAVEEGIDRRPQTAAAPEDNMIHLQVDMDSRPFLDKVFPATKNGTVLISARAVV